MHSDQPCSDLFITGGDGDLGRHEKRKTLQQGAQKSTAHGSALSLLNRAAPASSARR